MHVADSVGPGGIMRAMRNVPVLAEVARNVAEVAPDAYVFNYTNPAPTEAMAMRRAAPAVKTFALCSCTGHPGSAEWLAGEAGVGPTRSRCRRWSAGINHCASVQQLRLMRRHRRDAAGARERDQPGGASGRSTPTACCRTAGATGSSTSRSCSGSMSEYAGTAQGVKMRYGITTHDMAYEKARVAELEALAATWTAPDSGAVTLADLPEGDEDWGIEVIDIMESIVANRNRVFVVNAPQRRRDPQPARTTRSSR